MILGVGVDNIEAEQRFDAIFSKGFLKALAD
jgi:hypothetical protein